MHRCGPPQGAPWAAVGARRCREFGDGSHRAEGPQQSLCESHSIIGRPGSGAAVCLPQGHCSRPSSSRTGISHRTSCQPVAHPCHLGWLHLGDVESRLGVGWADLGLQKEVAGEKEGTGEGTVSSDTPALGPSCFLVFQEAQRLPKSRPRMDMRPPSPSPQHSWAQIRRLRAAESPR